MIKTLNLSCVTKSRADITFQKSFSSSENVSANLTNSGDPKFSRLIVKVEEANPWFGNVRFDNYSPESIGSERFRFSGGNRNLNRVGDQISFGFTRSMTAGSNIFDITYEIPLSAQENSISFRAVIDRTEVTIDALEAIGIEGESELYEIDYQHPIIRTIAEELTLLVGFSHKDGQTFIFDDISQRFGIGPDEDGVSRTSVLRFGSSYIRRDQQGAWAFRSLVNIGVDLLNPTQNTGDSPDSNFVSFLGQVQRVQRLSEDHLLIFQGDIQLTPDPLLPSQQFVIGGGQSVRGYRQNARSADNGIRFSVSDRIALERSPATAEPTLQLVPFVDLGAVWNHPDNPNQQASQRFLVSTGVGFLWEPYPGLTFQMDYAIPFVDLKDQGNNIQDSGIFFKLNYEL
jgi:hemolysin activation/secretion protein